MAFTIPAGQQDAMFARPLPRSKPDRRRHDQPHIQALDRRDGRHTVARASTNIRIAPSAPVITKLELNRVSGGFELVVTGYSTPRH